MDMIFGQIYESTGNSITKEYGTGAGFKS